MAPGFPALLLSSLFPFPTLPDRITVTIPRAFLSFNASESMSTEENSASMVEHGGSVPREKLEGDEAELARMGYKQELK